MTKEEVECNLAELRQNVVVECSRINIRFDLSMC
jgi:hypothetical protein